MEQLQLFQESKEEKLMRQVEKLQKQCENIRKGLFAKQNRTENLALELQKEVEFLKSQICKNGIKSDLCFFG